MSREDLRLAVVGVGYLGHFHAQKLARIKGVELVGVVDQDLERAEAVARELSCLAWEHHSQIPEQVQAACVVTPTASHFEVSRDLLQAGMDVLCEKPFTATLAEADHLVGLAQQRGCLLQVGHLERFNPAVASMFDRVKRPLFIEVNRIAPFKARSTDVDVVLDLMIHDLDIILALVGQEPSEVRAKGVPVLGPHADLVNARLEFPGGCVANLTASRLALKDERKMRIFQPESYVSVDFRKRRLIVVDRVEYRPGKDPKVKADKLRFGSSDPLEEELKAFVESVRTRRPPLVGGLEARRVLACALLVRQCVQEGLSGLKELLGSTRPWVEASGPEEDRGD